MMQEQQSVHDDNVGLTIFLQPPATDDLEYVVAPEVRHFSPDEPDADLSVAETHNLELAYWPEWGTARVGEPPRAAHVRPVSDLEVRAAELASQATQAIDELNRIAGSDDKQTRNAAVAALAQAQLGISPPKEVFVVQDRTFSLGRLVDDRLSEQKERARNHRISRRSDRLTWTYVGLLLSALAGALVTVESLWWAPAVIVGLRQFLTLGLGGDGTLPFEGPTSGTGARAIYRCWATHLSDVLVLFGFVAVGAFNAWPVALIAVASIIAVLFGVILRTSALQLGIQVNRLTLERVVRPWPPVLALVIAILVPAHSSLVLALGLLLGPFSYGLGEQVRSAIRINRELRGKDGRPIGRTVTLSSKDTYADGSIVLANRNRVITMMDDPEEGDDAGGSRARAIA